ncbi:TetR/AcrR family transcriptional regulator [Novipirellula artificiosorum]|nr:TetR/AcrR family transcriptional regulator [Novipirellula artificiosorum]
MQNNAPNRAEEALFSAEIETDPKRKCILEAAIETFAQNGFRGTDVQEVANLASVGKGTVYRSYGTKEELFWAVSREVDGRLIKHINDGLKQPSEDYRDHLRSIAIRFAEFHAQNPSCLEIAILARSEFQGSIPEHHLAQHREQLEILTTQFENFQQTACGHSVSSRDLMYCFIAMLRGVVNMYCYAESFEWSKSLVEFMEISVDVFLRGLEQDGAQ